MEELPLGSTALLSALSTIVVALAVIVFFGSAVMLFFFKRVDAKLFGNGKIDGTGYVVPAHRYRRTTPYEFPLANANFYESCRLELERERFRHLGDFEDIDTNRTILTIRGCERIMLSADRSTVASIAHFRYRFLPRVLAGLGGAGVEYYISFSREAMDGRFFILIASKLRKFMPTPPPEVVMTFVPESTDASAGHEVFRAVYASFLDDNPDFVPLLFADAAEVLASSQRLTEMLKRTQFKIDRMTKEALIARGASPEEADEALAQYRADTIERARRSPV